MCHREMQLRGSTYAPFDVFSCIVGPECLIEQTRVVTANQDEDNNDDD